jgi:hypothetical protein
MVIFIRTDSDYIESVRYDIKVSFRRHVCKHQHKISHTAFSGMFMAYPHKKFHTPSSTGSFTTTKQKYKK